MPYQNEHSARLRDPKDFNPDSFRRKANGTIYGKIKVPKTVAVIWGKLKGKDKPSDNPIPQALRFPIKSWTAEKAKAWLKKNGVKYRTFEPAKPKKKEKQNTAPVNACVFNEGSDVCLAEDEGEKEEGRFRIVAYSGRIIPNHWLWGNMALDLEGLKFDKAKTAVLEEHFTANRIGFTTSQDIKDEVIVDGKFLRNMRAKAIKDDMEDGFPMQASIYVPPTLIEHVKEGESAKVNGQTLKGPGTIFRRAVIREVSMCALGADSHTQSKVFAGGGKQEDEVKFSVLKKENIMAEEEKVLELTAEMLTADYPEIHEEVTAKAAEEGKAEGQKKEMERFKQIRELAPDDAQFAVEQYELGKSVDDAKTALIIRLREQKEEAAKAAKTAGRNSVTAAKQEFSDEAVGKDTTPPADTEDAWKKEFAESELVQAEFGGSEANYLAFKKAEKDGRVNLISNVS